MKKYYYYITKIFCKIFLFFIPKVTRANIADCSNYFQKLSCKSLDSLSIPRSDTESQHSDVQKLFFASFENAILIGPHSIPFTKNGRLIVEPIQRRELILLHETVLYMGMIKFFVSYFKYTRSVVDFLEGNILYLLPRIKQNMNTPHYGHWIGEHLSQLCSISMVDNERYIPKKVLVNNNPPNWQYQSLKALIGFRDLQILSIKSSDTVQVEFLSITSLKNVHSEAYEFDPLYRRLLTHSIEQIEKKFVSSPMPKRVFIPRQFENSRVIKNYSEVCHVLSSYGFEVHDTRQYDFDEEICKFINTEIIIGPFGSNLIKMLFSPKLKCLIEIYSPETKMKPVWKLMASELNIKHMRVPATSLLLDGKLIWDVDVEHLEKSLIDCLEV